MIDRSLKEVRVLVAEDSSTVRHHLTRMINETPGMRVIGQARDGEEVIAMVDELRPDVISMDISMPRIDGLEATRQIMTRNPTPVVVVTSMIDRDVDLSFHALQAGALAVVGKPPDRNNPAFPDKQRELVKTLRAMSEVRVIHRRRGNHTGRAEAVAKLPAKRPRDRPEIIAIGASAGGPSALSHILKELPAELSVPIVIAQHMPGDFVRGLARWLNKTTPLEVKLAEDGDVLESGVVNLSPGGRHLTVIRRDGRLITRLLHEKGPYSYQPSVDVLFQSVATSCGLASIGIVLTGMGDDGAAGLLAMYDLGAYTLAQDEQSSTVFGMPGAAIDRGAVADVVPLVNIASAILKLV